MRDLKVGDRVKITGPWLPGGGVGLWKIGDIEVVIKVEAKETLLPILLEGNYWWCRENLRALPRPSMRFWRFPMSDDPRDTLAPDEFHPAVESARAWYDAFAEKGTYMGAFSTTAIEGNRLSEICYETMRRLRDDEPVGDRYFLGLVWTLRDMEGK